MELGIRLGGRINIQQQTYQFVLSQDLRVDQNTLN